MLSSGKVLSNARLNSYTKMMFSFTIFVYWSALYSHFKCKVLELFNMNVKNIIAWIHTNITNLSTIKDFS